MLIFYLNYIEDASENIPDVDDTDGIDVDAEFDAWRLRELKRIHRGKEAQAKRDEEIEEIERRRAMPEDVRLKEDTEIARQKREEKSKRSKGLYMQKYWHKGAFYNDMDVLQRDLSGPTMNQVDISKLPKVMQTRDFGKAGQTKHKTLREEDTSLPTSRSKNNNNDVDHRFKSQDEIDRSVKRQKVD